MSSSKQYMEFIKEQLSQIEDVMFRAMMGEYIIYYHGVVIGGIYDNRFLIKPTHSVTNYIQNVQYELPYDGAKKMILVDNIDDKIFLADLLNAVYNDLKKRI